VPLALRSPVLAVHLEAGRAVAATLGSEHGGRRRVAVSGVISTMPLGELVAALDPPVSPHVLAAATRLRHRDFLLVALVVPEALGFPDNWIYVHAPEVAVGRIQNFGSWSPDMVRDGRTCLGLEYFVSRDGALWHSADDDLVARATSELERLGLVPASSVEAGYVVRAAKAYPRYDASYRADVGAVAEYLAANAPNVQPAGRNGMHRYGNQDDAMFTAMLAVENLGGAQHDIWSAAIDGAAGSTGLGRMTTPGMPRGDGGHPQRRAPRWGRTSASRRRRLAHESSGGSPPSRGWMTSSWSAPSEEKRATHSSGVHRL
jgi:protoporphyrinogen oxidase